MNETLSRLEIPARECFPSSGALFYALASSLPYPVTVYFPDGYLAFVNKAWAELFHVKDPGELIGKYNVLSDPDMKRWGYAGIIQKAYGGLTSELREIKVPLQEIVDKYGDGTPRTELLFQTILCFPVYVGGETVPHVGVVYINTMEHLGSEAVLKAKRFMQEHWMEEFHLDQVASAVYMSRYHFSRVFKKEAGMSPYQYFRSLKIERIKQRLSHTSFSVANAFSACGLVYSGSTAALFRKKVGMTPTEYRKFLTEK